MATVVGRRHAIGAGAAHFVAYLIRRLVFEGVQPERVAEYPQHFPAGTRLAQRRGRGAKALPGALEVDISAGGLRKRSQRQEYMRYFAQGVADEGRDRDDALRGCKGADAVRIKR